MNDPRLPQPPTIPDPAAADPSWASSPAGYFPQSHHGGPYPVPAQYAAAPQAPGQVGGYATARPGRAQLSRRVRACLIIELVAFTLVLVERFLPDFFADVSLYLMRFSFPWFWVWTLVYALFVVLSVVSLSLRSSVARYALAGSILVAFFVADPLLSAWSGNPWYLVFLLPEMDTSLYADDPFLLAMYVRSLVLWSLYRIGIIAAIVLAVPDPRGTAGAVPRGASSVPAQRMRAHGGSKWEGVGGGEH